MPDTPYTRAISAFEALVLPVQTEQFSTPAALVRASGLPSSTGYRHMTTLEGNGLLTRDKSGVYLIGPTALRIGLSAHGAGHLAVLAPPVLWRLREATGRTSFIAVQRNDTLNLSAFSSGRAGAPAPRYHMSLDACPPDTDVNDVLLTDPAGDPARRFRALMHRVPGTKLAYLGLFAGSANEDDPTLIAHLKRTVSLFPDPTEAAS